MDEQQELRRRRLAIRLWLKGVTPKRILEKVQRSRVWLSKWQKRFDQAGASGFAATHDDPGTRQVRTHPRSCG